MALASHQPPAASGDFRLQRVTPPSATLKLGGGVLMAWGVITALGRTVGKLLSGIMAEAVWGCVFAVEGIHRRYPKDA